MSEPRWRDDGVHLGQAFLRWRQVAQTWPRSRDLVERFAIASEMLNMVPLCSESIDVGVVVRTMCSLAARFFQCAGPSSAVSSHSEQRIRSALAAIRASHAAPDFSLSLVAAKVR